MRTAAIMTALAAAINSALADAVCNPRTLHYKPRMISVVERNGFANIIDEVCSNTTEKSVQELFESTLFSRNSTKETFSEDECKTNFHSIIKACIAGKNTGGGTLSANGLTLEIQLDTSKNEVRGLEIAQEKESKKSKVTTPKSSNPKVSAPTPGNKKDPKKPKDKTPKKPPVGKACSLKPGKGKEAGKGTGKGKTDTGKTPTKVVRDLISKLLRRTGNPKSPSSPPSPSDYGSDADCGDVAMAAGGSWGADTYLGFRNEPISEMSDKILVNFAKAAYQEVLAERKASDFIVAALFVPNKGVYLGTVPHGKGVYWVETFAPENAKRLWEVLGDRNHKYHAEDTAMLHAIENKAHDGDSKFPAGSAMATWGKFKNKPKDEQVAACGAIPVVDPSCQTTLRVMGVKQAKML
jgi:hypothetical protein